MNQIKQHLFTYIPLILAYVFSANVLAVDSVPNKIDVVTEFLEPYQVQNPDGSVGGYSTDIVRALFKQTKMTATIKAMPWARAYEVAKSQPNTMIYSIAHTKHRDKQFRWVGSVKKERLYFWGLRKYFPHPVATEALLKGLKVAASRNSNVAQYLISNKFFNIYQLIKEEQNMLMLYRERVDLIVATELTLQNRAKKLGLDFSKMAKIKEVKELNNDLSIAFSKNTAPELVSRFQLAFKQLTQNGTIRKLKRKWKIP